MLKLRRWRFRTQLLAGYLALVSLVEVVTILALQRSLSADLQHSLGARLEQQGRAAVKWLAAGGRHPHRLVTRMADVVGAQVTIFDPSGVVLGDSSRHSALRLDGGGEGAGPEVAEARRHGVGRAVRRTRSAAHELRYWVALPASDGMVVRLSVPMSGIQTTLQGLRRQLWIAASIGLAAALLLGWLVARLVARPLRDMTDAATELTHGNYDIRIPSGTRDEFGTLAAALSLLAARLKEKIGELTAERERLQHLQTMREAFVADISHELRTPIAAIQGFAETLLRAQPNAATTHEFLEVIHRHAQRIGRLVADLLRLSDLDAQAPGTALRQPVDLLAVARQVATTLGPTAAARRVRIEVPNTSLLALGDPGAIEQILENLIGNAIRYGNEDGSVTVRAHRQADRVCLEVEDDGPGIAAEHQPHLFERFYRTDPGRSRERGGTGLGLAIVRSLTESLGGRVDVHSQLGHGACFRVYLPAA